MIIKFVQILLLIEVGVVINNILMVVFYSLLMGVVIIINMVVLNGVLNIYWGDGIMDVVVIIIGFGYEEMMMISENGIYNLLEFNLGMEYSVSVSKNVVVDNGLLIYVFFIGQCFLLGMNLLQIILFYQVIVGDVNCSNVFIMFDFFLIQCFIIGVQVEFDNCFFWVFVIEGQDMLMDFDVYNVFLYVLMNIMMLMELEIVNFVGVKVGDIFGEVNLSNFGGENEG